jgi:hypothetical protein
MKKKNNIEGYERLKIGSNIRKWRNIKEIKQKDLAASMRLSEAAISNIENDLTDLTLSQIEDISLSLDVPLEKLFTDPQETLAKKSAYPATFDAQSQYLLEKDFLYAMIGTIQKKDEEFKGVMENVIQTIKGLTNKNPIG